MRSQQLSAASLSPEAEDEGGLAAFLIDRACNNCNIANYFFWDGLVGELTMRRKHEFVAEMMANMEHFPASYSNGFGSARGSSLFVIIFCLSKPKGIRRLLSPVSKKI